MKYKNIKSAIHNFGYSFISDENYVDNEYVFHELASIHSQGHDITIDWLSGKFEPAHLCTGRIQESIGYWTKSLKRLLDSQNVNLEALASIDFV